jgi:hypothetical protein
MNDSDASLLAEVTACRHLIEEYVKRLDEASADYYKTGKTVFPNLSHAEMEDISQQCESILSRLTSIIPDAMRRWQSIRYPIERYDTEVERVRELWVRRGNIFRTIEVNLRTKLDLQSGTKESTQPTPRNSHPEKPIITVLFLAANPTETAHLDLDNEKNAIEDELRKSKLRDQFNLESRFALRADQISEQLLMYSPQVVHFSGHGSEAGEIILQDISGRKHPVDASAICNLFSLLKDNIRCVVLNACYSEIQADLIAKYIDCVIGMSTAIGDEAAIKFAQGFYRGLGYEKDLETSFKLGRSQIDLEGLDEEDTPKIKWKDNVPKKIVLTDIQR